MSKNPEGLNNPTNSDSSEIPLSPEELAVLAILDRASQRLHLDVLQLMQMMASMRTLEEDDSQGQLQPCGEATTKKIVFESHPTSPWDEAQIIAFDCQVNGVIPIDKLQDRLNRLTSINSGKNYQAIKKYAEMIHIGIQQHGSDSIFQLWLPIKVINILQNAHIEKISDLKKKMKSGKTNHMRGIGPAYLAQISTSLNIFDSASDSRAAILSSQP